MSSAVLVDLHVANASGHEGQNCHEPKRLLSYEMSHMQHADSQCAALDLVSKLMVTLFPGLPAHPIDRLEIVLVELILCLYFS